MAKKISDDILDELLRGCDRPEDLLGDGGLIRDLKKALMQRMLDAELTEHLGYGHGEEAPPVQTNRRNGAHRPAGKTARAILPVGESLVGFSSASRVGAAMRLPRLVSSSIDMIKEADCANLGGGFPAVHDRHDPIKTTDPQPDSG